MSALFSQPLNLGEPNDKRQDFGMDWSSTLNPEASTQSRLTPEDRPQLEDDTGLELDLGEDLPFGDDGTSMSIEVGRNAPAERPAGEDLFSDDNKLLDGDDLDLDLGEDVPMPDGPSLATVIAHDNIDNLIGQDDGITFGADETLGLIDETGDQRRRESQSPLSEAPSDLVRQLDQTFGDEEEVEEIAARQPQRSKKRKALLPDTQTVLKSQQIKDQQNDRSKILKPASFLPRDPVLLTLMNMQKNGDFVSNIMGDGRSRVWAPELRGILSIDVIRGPTDLKRKRDSGIADVSGDEHPDKVPRLEFEEDELPVDEGIAVGGESSLNQEQTQIELPADDGIQQPAMSDPVEAENARSPNDGEDEGIGGGDYDHFEDTTVPLLHPADSGPVSLGTKHAVHLLRDRLGGENADGSPASQSKKSVLFQDLLPEGRASKEDATKMFFEILVLATKDAVKADQSEKRIGGPIRIRGKRGLWGSWAEAEASTEGDAPAGTAASA